MSHVHEGPLATYSSLTDKNLAGYFANTRMRKHLKKAGLVNKRGELVSENQYRLSMARKEHKKHVKNLLAQAIVHKSLDLERTRQVEIRRKLEEIAKIELVRRVRASEKRSNDAFLLPLVTYKKPPSPPPPPTPSPPPEEEEDSEIASRGRKGDEEILPYLSPRESRATSRPATASEVRYRPQSAPAPAREAPPEYEETNVIYVDEHGRRLSPDRRDQERPQRGRPEEIDTKHLYSLDSTALKKYALQLARIDQGEVSPYLLSPVPTPPRSSRGSRSGMVGQRLRVRPRTAEARSPYRERPSSGQVQSVSGSSKSSEISPKSTPKGTPRRRFQQQRFVEGTLMLHRQEPAMMHQGEVQTLCEITMKYHGPNLTLPRDQRDPTQAVSIDQQHCGGNTLTVFKENLQPADTFSFISRRHRGFPFSLSIFVDGRIDCRISTCCEYRHAKGVKLGGKMGHFSLLKVKGATPCYKCKLNSQASPRSLKRPPTFKKDKGQPEQMQEEVIVVDKRSVMVTQDEDVEEDQNIEIPVEDDPEKGKVKHDTYIEPENDLDLGLQNDEKSNKEAKSDAKRSKQRVTKRDIVVSTTKANDSEDKYESDFEDEEDTKKENDVEDTDDTPREIKGGNFEDDLSAEASKTTGNSSQDGVEEGSPLRTSTPLSKDCTPIVDWDEENDEPVVKRRESDTTNRAGKQVRFDVKVQKMGTPETSESNRNGDNDDTVGKVEPLYKDSDDKLMKELKELLDEDDGLDTCDEVSELETDLDSPRKDGEGRSRKTEKAKQKKGSKNVVDGSGSDLSVKNVEKELDDPKDSDKSSSSDSKRVHGSDDNYSDDFENSNSSDSTVKEIKDNKEEVTERKVKPGPRGEYYDEAYACDDENVPMHDGNEEMHVGNEEMHDKKAVSHKALNGQKPASHITADIISIKSLEEDKKYYLSDDETDRDEIEKGPLATTFEDMNIIGPLATLLVKVRRIKRLNAAKGSHSDLNSDNLDGVSRNSVGSMLEEESLEYAGNIVTESSSLSSLNWDELPNGKKKLDPIKKKKKSKAKVNQNDHSFDSEEEYVERPLQRRLSNASILSREYIQATQEVVMSVLESQRQMAKSCKQVADSSKIVMASSKEVLESSKQVNESSKQVNESSKQVNNSSQQVIASSKHVIESAMHAVEVLKKTADEYKSSNGQSDPAVERQSEKETTKDGDMKPEEKESLQNQEEEKKKTEDPVEVVDEAQKETVTVTSVPTEDDDFKEDSSVSHASSRATDERSHNTDESTECADFIPEEDIPHDFEDTVFDKVVRLFDSVPQPDEPHSHEEKQDTEKTESDDSPQIVKGKTYFDLLREKKLERKPILKRRMTVPDNFKPQSTEDEEGEETITMTVPKTFLYMEYGHKEPFEENTYTETVEVRTTVKSPRKSPRDEETENSLEKAQEGIDRDRPNVRDRIMSDSALLFNKCQELDLNNVDNHSLNSLDISAEAELLADASIQKAEKELIIASLLKSKDFVSPRTDPDGHVSGYQHNECNEGNDHAQSDVDTPRRGELRRQAAMMNLFESVEKSPVTGVDSASGKKVTFAEQNSIPKKLHEDDTDSILSTSEEASLVVNRVVEGLEKEMIEERSRKVSKIPKDTQVKADDECKEKDMQSMKTENNVETETYENNGSNEKSVSGPDNAGLLKESHLKNSNENKTETVTDDDDKTKVRDDIVENITAQGGDDTDSSLVNVDSHDHKTVTEAIIHAGETTASVAHVDIEKLSTQKVDEANENEINADSHDHKTVKEAIIHAGETTANVAYVDIEKLLTQKDDEANEYERNADSHDHKTVKEAIIHAGETTASVAHVDIEKLWTQKDDEANENERNADAHDQNSVAEAIIHAGETTASVAHVDIEKLSAQKGDELNENEMNADSHDHKTVKEAIIHAGETTASVTHVDIEKLSTFEQTKGQINNHKEDDSCESQMNADSHDHKNVNEAIIHAGETTASVAHVDIEKLSVKKEDGEKESQTQSHDHTTMAESIIHAGETSAAITHVDIENLSHQKEGVSINTFEGSRGDEVESKAGVIKTLTESHNQTDKIALLAKTGDGETDQAKRSEETGTGCSFNDDRIIPEKVPTLKADFDSKEISEQEQLDDLSSDGSRKNLDIAPLPTEGEVIPSPVIDSPNEMQRSTHADQNLDEELPTKSDILVKEEHASCNMGVKEVKKENKGSEVRTQKPTLVKMKSGAMVVQYPEEISTSPSSNGVHSSTEDGKASEEVNVKARKQDNTDTILQDLEEEILEESVQKTTSEVSTDKTTEDDLKKLEEAIVNGDEKEYNEESAQSKFLTQRPSITITEASNSPRMSDVEDVQDVNVEEEEANGKNGEVEDDNIQQVEKEKEESSTGNSNKTDVDDFFDNTVVPEDDLTHIDVVGKEKVEEEKEFFTNEANEESDKQPSVPTDQEDLNTDGPEECVKFFENGQEIKNSDPTLNNDINKEDNNIITTKDENTITSVIIDGKVIDLDNLGDLDQETYKKVMSIAYNVDVMSIISEEQTKKYEDEKFEEASSKSSKSSKSSSSSSSSESEPEQDDVDRNSVTHLVYEKKEEKRIIGLKEDEDLEEEKKTEKISVKDTDSVSDVNVPGRKITSYSDDEEYPDGPKYDTTENSNMATKVEKETKERQERSKRRDSSSSRSSSSSSDRKKRDSSSEDEKNVIKVPSPPAEKRKSPSPVLRTRKSSSSSSSSSDGVEKRKKKSPSPVLKKKSSSSSSSSSEDEAKKRKKTPSPTEKRISPIIMEQQRRRGSQSSTSSVHISEAEEEVKKPSPPPQSPPKSPVRSPPRSPLKSPPKSSSSSSASEAEEEKPKEKIIVARTASPDRLGSPARRASPERASSPFPVESFAYKSYAESLPSDDDRRELKRQNSVPDRFAYRRVYENEKNDIVVTATIPVNTKSPSPPLEKRKSPSPPLEKRKSPSPTMEKRKSSSSSSSSSSESEEESKKKPEPQVVEAKKSKSSSSSSSSSESEHEKKVDDKPSAKPEEKKSSSSSSSSDSSSESEKEPEVKKQDVAPEIDRRSPVSQVKADVKKSSSSSSDSSSSESEAEKKVVAKPPSPKLPETLDQVKQKDLSSSGSSSDSSSDSESESDTARTPKQPEVTKSRDSPNKTVVSVDVEKQRSPSPPKEEPKDGAAKQSSSSSSSSSGSDSSDSEDEKPKKEEDKAKSPEVKAPSPPPPVVVAPTVVKPEDIKDGGKKPESSSSDDSSSGSSSSDDTSSEDEDNKKKEEEKKDEELEKIKKDVQKSESEDDKKPSTISESESDHKKISIFASESEGDNMYGGHDPDNAVEGVGAGTSYLRKIGVKPGVTHQGSVSNLLEGKEDVDLNGISLNNDQVEEVGQYIRKQSCLKTLSIRNGQMTNSQFETIADSLIQSKAKVAMLNFSLNKLGESSAEKIVELITDIPTVSILMLHGNPIGDSGVKTLVDGLLDLHYANTGDNEDARTNPDFCKLTELDLGETGLSDDGADQISRLIESNMSLKTLYMIGNKRITSAGWKKIGKALRRNTTLENLSLDFTNLGDEGLAALIVGLRDNQTLKTLDLEGTGLTEEGGKKLVELLKCNTTILDIAVSPGNKISEYVRGEIRNYLGLNRAAAQPKPFK